MSWEHINADSTPTSLVQRYKDLLPYQSSLEMLATARVINNKDDILANLQYYSSTHSPIPVLLYLKNMVTDQGSKSDRANLGLALPERPLVGYITLIGDYYDLVSPKFLEITNKFLIRSPAPECMVMHSPKEETIAALSDLRRLSKVIAWTDNSFASQAIREYARVVTPLTTSWTSPTGLITPVKPFDPFEL